MQHDIKNSLDRLKIIMEEWADWQRGYSGSRGYSDHSIGLQSDKRVSGDSWEDILKETNDWVCKMVDAAVDDLPPGQGAAINKRYGVAAVFRFPRGNYEELLAEAHATLMQTLPKKGVVI